MATTMSAGDAAYRLGVQMTKGVELTRGRRGIPEGEEIGWSTATELLLGEIFGVDSAGVKGFKKARMMLSPSDYNNADSMDVKRQWKVEQGIAILKSLIDLLNKRAEQEKQMAKRSQSKPIVGAPTLNPGDGAARIREQIRKGQELVNAGVSPADEQTWETVTKRVLSQAFGDNSDPVNSVMEVGKHTYYFGSATEEQYAVHRRTKMETRITILDGLAEALETEARAMVPPSAPVVDLDKSKVFLVHGHEDGVVEACARMVERFGLEAIILHERPNEGRTIIEKFEHHAKAGFAIVFLTPDDVGGAKGAALSSRARQNVILELGYFIGALGRKNVCALYREGVELPSDYNGVLYVSLDKADWKMKVSQEMKAAGLEVDLNKVNSLP